MPQGKKSGTATTSNLAKARKDTETTLTDKSTNLDPSLTTTTKPRRSPRNHGPLVTAAKEQPLSRANQQSAIGKNLTIKKDAYVRNTTARRATTEATVTSKAAVKSTRKSKDKEKTVAQANRRTSGGSKSAEPVSPSTSTRHLQPSPEPKALTKPERRTVRDAEGGVSGHRTQRQRGKADDPRKALAIGPGTRSKDTYKSVTEPIPAPVHNAETLYTLEPQAGPIQEDCCASGSRHLLTEAALEELARELESIDPTKCNRSARKKAVEHSEKDSEDGSSQGSDIDSQERFNRKWGYVPPLDEETIRIIEAIIENPTRAVTMVGIGPGNIEFLSGLHNRNVLSDPSTHLDPREEEIRSISLKGFLQETQEQKASHEELWKSDKAKCTPDSSEALFQRTLMISLIARHVLIYQFDSSKEQIFDFSVEEAWSCQPMPSRLLWDIPKGQKSEAKYLSQPKPDLAVCLKREAVISDSMWKTLPEPTKGLVCFENMSSNVSRVFHFLAVEAKKAMIDLDSPQALHQCLNNASQALHNMFEFFRDAGPEHEQIFYNKVRFFSIVANRKGIVVRIHRAIRKPDDASLWELVMPDRPDYRLEFEFREFQRIGDGDEFCRKRVLEVVKKILKYAKDDLLSMIKAAASKLAQNLEKDIGLHRARREVGFYSYGLRNPKSSKTSKGTSVDQSTIGDGVQRQLQSANLDSKCASTDRSMASGQTTLRQPRQPIISSRLVNIAKKRRLDEIELDELEDMRAPDPPVWKRRKPSHSNSGGSLPSPAVAGITIGSQRGRRPRAG